MTIEEAIEQLTPVLKIEKGRIHKDISLIGALETAIKALEKQIPKKYELFLGQDLCPTCNNTFGSDAIRKTLSSWKMNYCQYCGQALDWSDENE